MSGKLLHSVYIFVRLIYPEHDTWNLFLYSEITRDSFVLSEFISVLVWLAERTMIWLNSSCPALPLPSSKYMMSPRLRLLPSFGTSKWIFDFTTPLTSHLFHKASLLLLLVVQVEQSFLLPLVLLAVIIVFILNCMLYGHLTFVVLVFLVFLTRFLNSWSLWTAFYYYILLELSNSGI